MKINPEEALEKLKQLELPFISLFKNASIEVEIYRPDRVNHQTPHTRDEIYVIIAGKGQFVQKGERFSFAPGDLFFVPAGEEHQFEEFSEDFSTWVLFFDTTNETI